MAEPVLLDTCAALWLVAEAPISAASRAAISAARDEGAGVYVSPFSAWEIGTLVAKRRIHLHLSPEVWFEALIALPGILLAPLPPSILLASTSLPGNPPADPADRIIAATSRAQGYIVITRDRRILDYAQQGFIRAVAC